MKLKDLKQWIETLPNHFLEFEIVNGEEGDLDGTDMHYRLDTPITTLNVDEESKEILFLNKELKSE